jgi:hypothetical protein
LEAVNAIALSMGAAWASGINLYAAVLMLGLLQSTGNIELPPELRFVADPLVLIAAGFMYCVEFFADKTPGLDSAWDAVHSFIRIPAGAVLAASALGDVGPAAELAAGLVGGGLAATSHFTKAGSRLLINTSPEPFTNWAASLAEDAAVFAGLWAALHHPWIFLALLVGFLAVAAWLLPRLWRGIRALGARVVRFLRGTSAPSPGTPPETPGPTPG